MSLFYYGMRTLIFVPSCSTIFNDYNDGDMLHCYFSDVEIPRVLRLQSFDLVASPKKITAACFSQH